MSSSDVDDLRQRLRRVEILLSVIATAQGIQSLPILL